MTAILPSLLTGIITGCIALAGVMYTQAKAARREDARWDREEARLLAERDWHREVWAREHRRESHLAFLAEQQRLDQWAMMYARVGLETEAPDPGWMQALSRHLMDVYVFGSADAAVAAQRLFLATNEIPGGAVGDLTRVDALREEYRRAVQRDLGLQETELYKPDDTLKTP